MLHRRRDHDTTIGINMTPMIDVVFLLIIFFMVVSHVVSSQAQPVDLPHPDASQARAHEGPEKITVTLVGDGTGAVMRRNLNAQLVADDAELLARLTAIGQLAGESARLEVVVRADKSIACRHIRRTLQAIARSGVARMDIAVRGDDAEPQRQGG